MITRKQGSLTSVGRERRSQVWHGPYGSVGCGRHYPKSQPSNLQDSESARPYISNVILPEDAACDI